jgi:octopine/nopaline transport system substrate-binding protein
MDLGIDPRKDASMKSTGSPLSATFLLMASIALAGCAKSDERGGDTLRIATEGAYPPWNFTAPDGHLDGYDIDVAHALCKRMKVSCKIMAQDWDGVLPALNAGKYDALVSAMAPTDERRKVVDFTKQYALGPRSFMALKSNPLDAVPVEKRTFDFTKGPADAIRAVRRLRSILKGKIIGVQGSTTNAAFMDRYLKGVVKVREYKTTDQILLDLHIGRIDATFDDLGYLMSVTGSSGGKDLALFGPRFDGGMLGDGSAIAIRKGDIPLRTKFDAAIATLVTDGTLRRLSEKWFKIDIAPR